jgi:hypothetical protein
LTARSPGPALNKECNIIICEITVCWMLAGVS